MMEQVNDFVESMSDKLGELASSDLVVGEPQTYGEVTVVPLTRISVGMGGGGGSGSGDMDGSKSKRSRGSGKGTGAGSAGGVKIRPVAVVVFKPSGVEILPIPERVGKIEKLLDFIPGMVEDIKKKVEDKD
jgi:uncharacterized spore protein YtfJ